VCDLKSAWIAAEKYYDGAGMPVKPASSPTNGATRSLPTYYDFTKSESWLSSMVRIILSKYYQFLVPEF